MCIFAVSCEKGLWEHSPTEFQEQLLSKRIRDAAVCLKLLLENEPLPNGIEIKKYYDGPTINFCVEFPTKFSTAKIRASCDQFILSDENTA
jgi:hypothetical protein